MVEDSEVSIVILGFNKYNDNTLLISCKLASEWKLHLIECGFNCVIYKFYVNAYKKGIINDPLIRPTVIFVSF